MRDLLLLVFVFWGIFSGDVNDVVGSLDWALHQVSPSQQGLQDVGGANYPGARTLAIFVHIPGTVNLLLQGGGDPSNDNVDTTWLYDTTAPDATAWTLSGAGPLCKAHNAIAAATDEYVFSFGGECGVADDMSNATSVYSFGTGTWTLDIAHSGLAPDPPRSACQIWPRKTGDGFYVAGGSDGMGSQGLEMVYEFSVADVSASSPVGVWSAPLTTTNFPVGFMGWSWVDYSGTMERLYSLGGLDLPGGAMLGDLRYLDLGSTTAWTLLWDVQDTVSADYVNYYPGSRGFVISTQEDQFVYAYGGFTTPSGMEMRCDFWQLDVSALESTMENGVVWVKVEQNDTQLNMPPIYDTPGMLHPGARVGTSFAFVDSTFYVWGGIVPGGEMRNDMWSLDLCLPSCSGAHQVCVPIGGCECEVHWNGSACDVCADHWDGPACDACAGNWDGTECDTCAEYWDGTDCELCTEELDDTTGECAPPSSAGSGNLAQIIGGVVGGIVGVGVFIAVIAFVVVLIVCFMRPRKPGSATAAPSAPMTAIEPDKPQQHHSDSKSSSDSSSSDD